MTTQKSAIKRKIRILLDIWEKFETTQQERDRILNQVEELEIMLERLEDAEKERRARV